MKTKSVLIVGGGTSGLISALMLKTAFKNIKVDLVESSEIGIIGVGEGSTEHWDSFMRFCGITKQELVREAGATFKYGINFINWNGDNKNYFHAVNGEYNQKSLNKIQSMYLYLISQDADPLEMQGSYVADSLLPENNYGINQFHFDTFKLNTFLHNKCKDIGINIIEDTLESVSLGESGFVTSVNSTSKQSYTYDFFIDSSGFSKFILGKTYGIKCAAGFQ
jgi:thioredoxin reductase